MVNGSRNARQRTPAMVILMVSCVIKLGVGLPPLQRRSQAPSVLRPHASSNAVLSDAGRPTRATRDGASSSALGNLRISGGTVCVGRQQRHPASCRSSIFYNICPHAQAIGVRGLVVPRGLPVVGFNSGSKNSREGHHLGRFTYKVTTKKIKVLTPDHIDRGIRLVHRDAHAI